MTLTKVTHSMIADTVFNVKDYGAVGDNTTNDRQAIIDTIAAAKTNGGGTVLFPFGEYLISGVQQSVNIPQLDGTLQYVSTATQTQIYVQNLDNVNFVFEGAILRSNKTDGGVTLLFDGCSNLTFNNLHMIGATVMSGETATTTGTGGIGFVSLTQNSTNITLTNTQIKNHYSSIDIPGNPASLYNVKNITLAGSTYIGPGYYGITCRGNGRNVSVENLYSYQQNRGFFIYDTENVSVNGTIDFYSNTGYSPIVNAYTYNTRNIKINCAFINKLNGVTPRIQFTSQHNPAVQPIPAYLDNIFLNYTESNCGTDGVGITFNYYQNTTLQSSTSDVIFKNFTIVGSSSNSLSTNTTLTSLSNVCLINLDNFYGYSSTVGLNGKDILNNTGFVGAKKFTYTPSLKFSGNSTGMAYTTATASYYIQGGFCTVIGKITLSAKGSSTGSAQIIMPFYTREDSSDVPLIAVIGQSGMASISGPILGYVSAASGNTAVLFFQGTTGTTALTEANFTDTSSFIFQVTYPV